LRPNHNEKYVEAKDIREQKEVNGEQQRAQQQLVQFELACISTRAKRVPFLPLEQQCERMQNPQHSFVRSPHRVVEQAYVQCADGKHICRKRNKTR
jgi:hypothetical protein